MTPLRGLSAFTESERDVLFGRDRERDELDALVTGEGFRAGLLYGEPGVGKTSLLRAGVIPHLRDHGVIALLCADISHPIESFANAVTTASGLAPNHEETPIAFLARVVAQSLPGQLYLFILDQVDTLLSRPDHDKIVGDLADLFQRVVTRSGGRARFLFCCASSGFHLFGLLERRTGSLFPPTNRYELKRFQPTEASLVLERTLALAGVAADPQLSHVIVETLGREGPILPADVQIAALAVRELSITSPNQVTQFGGASELERLWLTAAAAATGKERSALRLVAELASGPVTNAYSAEWAATRASVDPAIAQLAFSVLCEKGVIVAVPVPGSQENHYQLAHEILAPRVREVAAPARASARRAFELLGSKASEGRRLSLREWREVKQERIAPATMEEIAVIDRTKRFYKIIAAAIAATPILFLIIIYFTMSGHYYLDVAGSESGGRVVVRAGRPGLSAFNWLPASPSFGSVVADTGFSRAMVDDASWDKIASHDIGGDLDGDAFVDDAMATLRPSLRSLVDYASGNDQALDSLRKGAEGPDDLVALFETLQPIARGGSEERAVVEQALDDPSPAVRAAALRVAQSVAQRRPDAYRDTLAKQLAATDPQQRRLAFTAVAALPPETARALYQAGLAANPNAAARDELLAAVSANNAGAGPSAAMAASMLGNRDISKSDTRRAQTMLRRAFTTNAAAATAAAAKLAASAKAPPEHRVFALELMLEYSPEESYAGAVDDLGIARRSKAAPVRDAALPVFAKFSPREAANVLAAMLDDKGLATGTRVAAALAWGELAKTKEGAAQGALEHLLKDPSTAVRAAAARAYGNLARPAQNQLVKMVKQEGQTVAVGAAYGLANSAAQGASPSVAAGGIAQLWKRKGRSRRVATMVFAKMARTHAKHVYNYLAAAARAKDDTGLHALGVDGMCAALAAGYRDAQTGIIRAAGDESSEVRRLAIDCVVDNPKFPKTATRVATRLADDPNGDIRSEAARVLAGIAGKGKVVQEVAATLIRMATDDNRAVRIIALGAITQMGADAPKSASGALAKAFAKADEGEKLALLAAARAIGASDLVGLAIRDSQPSVRIAAIDTAIATKTSVAVSINSALSDIDPTVRRAALLRLAAEKDSLDQEAIGKALALATRDSDPGISDLAMTTMARLVDADTAKGRLRAALAARSEATRARAAGACMGLIDRGDPKSAVELLEPVLGDPSHDVRVAMLPVLAAAYAATNSPEQLAEMLRNSERDAMKRLVATAAFIALARGEAGREAAPSALATVVDKGGPMAKMSATLATGLIAGSASGVDFLSVLVP